MTPTGAAIAASIVTSYTLPSTFIIKKTGIGAGKRAYELYQRYLYPEVKIEAILLPSPSSANASCSFDYLVQAYSILREENVS